MAQELNELYNKLTEIRKYLIKIGPERRKGNIVVVKLGEADKVVKDYNVFLNYFTNQKSLSKSECVIIQKLGIRFDNLYEQILDLCSQAECSTTVKMSATTKFDLKVALSLLPVCSDNEASIKQLIDGVEYYKSELDEESQEKLLNFVLKSRLSQAAKLKLSSSYDNIDNFIADLKTQLLPKKSASAIQRKLQNFRQNNLSIDDFGKQVTEMFVDLTISQSDGNDESFKILKPLNEKQAIKCFADGLRNRRLGTIVAARNFHSLKDAVQTAIDEDVMSAPSTSNDIFNINHRGRYSYFRSKNQSFAGRGRGRASYQVPASNQYQQQTQRWRGPQLSGRRGTRAFHGNRGKSYFNTFRNQRPHIHTLTNSEGISPPQESMSEQTQQNENEFFRD